MLQLNSVRVCYIFNSPLRVISDKKSTFAAKVIAVIAIAILSVATLGLYFVHAYRYFYAKKIVVKAPSQQSTNSEKLKQRASQLVDEGKLEDLLALFEKNPNLKMLPLEQYVLASGFNYDKIQSKDTGELYISELMIQAVQKGHIEIVKKLCELGANVNNRFASRGGKTALDWAIQFRHLEVVTFLIHEPTQQFSSEDLSHHLMNSAPELTSSTEEVKKFLYIIYLLCEKMTSIKSQRFSCIAMVASYWDEDEEICKKIITLMITKGDRLKKDNQQSIQSEAAKNYIKQEKGYQP